MSNKFALVNYGGSYQLEIKSAADLEALRLMDEVFWMATSAPAFSLNCSDAFIKILDKNNSGRILSCDVREAVLLLLDSLKNHERLNQRSSAISIADFADTPEALKLRASVKEILSNLNKSEDSELTLTDIRNDNEILKNGLSNGDGIIPQDHIEDLEMRTFVKDIITCLGSVDDIAGVEGVGSDKLQQFLKCSQDYINWKDSKSYNPDTLPLHEKTADAYAIFKKLQPKIEEYFKLCSLKRYNKILDRQLTDKTCKLEECSTTETATDYLKQAPLAPLNVIQQLKLDGEINPVYEEDLLSLREKVLDEFLARPVNSLLECDWLKVCDIFKPYEEWLASQKGIEVKSIDDSKLRDYLKSSLPDKLEDLIAEDKALGEKLKARHKLEEIVILQQEILDFCNNFVSFPNLYDPDQRAMFEAGHLIIDGRIFNFNIRVENVETHSKLASRSGIYIMYLEVTGSKTDQKFYICTPVTSRRLGLLGVHKRGVLFDLKGKEWDAKVIKILNNPVSLTEAVTAPFKKLSQLLIDAVDKISSSTEKQLEKQIGTAGQNIQKNITKIPEKKVETKVQSSATARDLMLTGSVTFAALGSSFAYISSTFTSMQWEQRAAAFSIGLLAILLPVVIVAVIKLYRRNISSILEASGWAINAHMRLTSKLAKILAPRPDSPGRVFRKKRDLLKNFSSRFKYRLKK
ncbi:MAG: hypothetical protein MK132_07315 [Lentisphaerales bacterium]|nr:hypothetical protein [Lentisphaerales bacterium]